MGPSAHRQTVWFGSPVTRPTLTRLVQARYLWAALIYWAAVILLFSSMRPAELPDAAFVFGDKINHFVAYLVGGWLAAAALLASRPRAGVPGLIMAAIALIAAFGIADEAFQLLTPGRTGASPQDWIADTLGATAGALLVLPFQRRLRALDTHLDTHKE